MWRKAVFWPRMDTNEHEWNQGRTLKYSVPRAFRLVFFDGPRGRKGW